MKSKFLTLVFLVSIINAIHVEATGDKVTIDTETQTLRTAGGAHLILHGVNVIYKIWPFIPSQGKFDAQNSLNTEDMVNLQKWGVNLVRLGVMWEAVETSSGVYNNTYLTEVLALVNKLGEYGIYTMLDAHQDVISRSTCGEGFPDF